MRPCRSGPPASTATGSWGGSSTAVTAQSKNKDAAAKFATWLNTDPEAVRPWSRRAASTRRDSAQAADRPWPRRRTFFSNQPDFYKVAASRQTRRPFTCGPNVNVAYSAYKDAFAKAASQAEECRSSAPSTSMQQATVDDLKKTGLQVK